MPPKRRAALSAAEKHAVKEFIKEWVLEECSESLQEEAAAAMLDMLGGCGLFSAAAALNEARKVTLHSFVIGPTLSILSLPLSSDRFSVQRNLRSGFRIDGRLRTPSPLHQTKT
jgi:hypothetical protein